MAVASPIVCKDYNARFRHRVLTNTQYWQAYVAKRLIDVTALDKERDRIITAISYALDLEEAWPQVYELVANFSSYMERRGYWAVWNPLLHRALRVARRRGDTTQVTNLTALLARLSFQQSRFEEAVKFYRQTIGMARQAGDLYNEARACSNLGYYFVERGYWYRAEVLCCHALRRFEQIDNNHGRAHTENHLGLLYTRTGSWAKAQHHLERACALWQAASDHHGLMRGLINLAVLYLELEYEDPDQALLYLDKALQFARHTGEEIEIGKIYINISTANRLKGDASQAEEYARQAEIVLQQFSNLAGLAMAWSALGLACLDQGKLEEARQYFETSLEARRKLNHQHEELKTLLYLVEYELARGNKRQAMDQLNEVKRHVDQLHQVKPYYRLQSLLAKYQSLLAEV